MLSNCTEHWASVEGQRVRFWVAGKGEPLVLVHGLLGYSFSWRYVIPLLAESREVLALDMLGSGFSDCPPAFDCRLSGAAHRLGQFLDSVRVSACDLAGSSYGGATVLMLAAQQPHRARKLILVSPANPWSHFGRRRLAMLSNPLVRAIFPKLARPARPLHNYFLRRLYGDPIRITREGYEGYSNPLRRGGRFEHAIRIVQSWQRDMHELKAWLPKASSLPTLVVWGSKDRAVDPASAGPLCRNFIDSRLEIIEGAGHLPYEECPKEFARIVLDFLRVAVPRGRPGGNLTT